MRSFKAHWIDQEIEANIGIGISWPTDIAPDECVLSNVYRDNSPWLSVGDTAVLASSFKDTFYTVATMYNSQRGDSGWIDPNLFQYSDATVIKCKVRFFLEGG